MHSRFRMGRPRPTACVDDCPEAAACAPPRDGGNGGAALAHAAAGTVAGTGAARRSESEGET